MSLYSRLIKNHLKEQDKKTEIKEAEHNMRTLKEWVQDKKKGRPSIFVDQDETILYACSLEELEIKNEWARKHAVTATIMGNPIGIIVRPHAKEFLIECTKIAPVYVLTAGISTYQKQVLDKAGLLYYFDEVYGRDTFHNVPKDRNAVLIDNLPHDSGNSHAKLIAMNGGMYCKVPDWNGRNPNDSVLLSIPSKIKKAFQSSKI